ncbi:hypothetical protein [Nonomuraea sp. NPDC049784]|uniref:hypothetical protein n=1 Tax=Nonomuraea sp. NPDC049784 TaxID=3154361 RepID=UPI0033F1668F
MNDLDSDRQRIPTYGRQMRVAAQAFEVRDGWLAAPHPFGDFGLGEPAISANPYKLLDQLHVAVDSSVLALYFWIVQVDA